MSRLFSAMHSRHTRLCVCLPDGRRPERDATLCARDRCRSSMTEETKGESFPCSPFLFDRPAIAEGIFFDVFSRPYTRASTHDLILLRYILCWIVSILFCCRTTRESKRRGVRRRFVFFRRVRQEAGDSATFVHLCDLNRCYAKRGVSFLCFSACLIFL